MFPDICETPEHSHNLLYLPHRDCLLVQPRDRTERGLSRLRHPGQYRTRSPWVTLASSSSKNVNSPNRSPWRMTSQRTLWLHPHKSWYVLLKSTPRWTPSPSACVGRDLIGTVGGGSPVILFLCRQEVCFLRGCVNGDFTTTERDGTAARELPWRRSSPYFVWFPHMCLSAAAYPE